MNWGSKQQRQAEKGDEREHGRRWKRETTRMEGNPRDGYVRIPLFITSSIKHHVTLVITVLGGNVGIGRTKTASMWTLECSITCSLYGGLYK